MKILKILLLFILALEIVAQQNTLELSSAEKFNKRGFFGNEDVAIKGNEIISDYDGNFMFSYPLVNVDLPNNLNGELTLTYNINVEHRGYFLNEAEVNHFINSPEWIIGFKGIALQTLNFETNIYFSERYDALSNPLGGCEAPLLIPGYHYSNDRQISTGMEIYDNIQIMRADGSKIILQNIDPDVDTGLYYERGKESKGFAIVQYYDNENLDENCPAYFRRVLYKPGDGLTYVFYEDGISFSNSPKYNCVIGTPRVLYLKEICTQNGHMLHFHYTDEMNAATIANGRKVFIGMQKSYVGTNVRDQFSLFYAYTGTNLLRIEIEDRQKNISTNLYIDNSNAPANLFALDMVQNKSRILNINRIEDNLGRETVFNYMYQTRQYGYYRSGGSLWSKKMELNYPILSSIEYYSGKKTELTFYDKFFPEVTERGMVLLEQEIKQATGNVVHAFRDCYTNFMLEKRKSYNRYGNGPIQNLSLIPIKEEIYTYTWDNILNTDTTALNKDSIGYIKTTIHTQSLSDLPAEEYYTQKFYKQFRTDDVDYNTGDNSATIKLITEIVTPNSSLNEKILKEYIYDWGNMQMGNGNYYYNGSFEILSVRTDKQSLNGDLVTNTVTYDPQLINVTLTGEIVSRQIKVKDYITQYDGKSLYSKTEYTHITPPNRVFNKNDFTYFFNPSPGFNIYLMLLTPNEAVFYQTELPLRETSYSNDKTKSIKEYQYYSSSPFTGLLQSISNKTQSGRVSSNSFSYYDPEIYLDHGGLIKETLDDKGVKTTFEYPMENGGSFNATVNAKQLDVAGLTHDITLFHTGFQTKPFKTTIEYSGGKTITTYTSYDKYGNLEFEVDANGYFTEMAYDKANRMVAIAAPGSFIQTGSPFVEINHYITDLALWTNSNNVGGNNNGYYPVENSTNSNTGDFWSHSFFYFDRPIQLPSATSDIATLKMNLSVVFNTFGSPATLIIKSIGSPFNGLNNITTTGQIYVDLDEVSWQDYKNVELNITNLLRGKNVYGIKIEVENEVRTKSAGNPGTTTGCSFIISGQPVCTVLKQNAQSVFAPSIVEQADTTGTKVIQYFDDENKIVVTDRENPASGAARKELVSLIKYDSFGKIRQTLLKNGSAFEQKSSKEYNYLGKVKNDITGDVNKNFTYDFLGRPLSEKFNGASTQKLFSYDSKINSLSKGAMQANYTDKTKVTDENSNTAIQYSDVVGNKVAEQTGSEIANDNTTIFVYDNIYRMTQVGSPNGIVSFYNYDNLGNLSSKSSPDEGTYFYSYDKWGNLRFQYHESKLTEVTYNNYDNLNRLISSGIINNNGFSGLNPDATIPGNDNTAVLINMYDEYLSTGVFASLNLGSVTLRNMKGRLAATAYRDKPGDPWNYKVYSYDQLGRVESTHIYE